MNPHLNKINCKDKNWPARKFGNDIRINIYDKTKHFSWFEKS